MVSYDHMALARRRAGRHVFIQLDFDPTKLPAGVKGEEPHDRVFYFLEEIINHTHVYARAFKIQAVCFQALGAQAIATLERVVACIKALEQGSIPVIIDFTGVEASNKTSQISPNNSLYGADAAIIDTAIAYASEHGMLRVHARKTLPDFDIQGVRACEVYRQPGKNHSEEKYADAAVRAAIDVNKELKRRVRGKSKK